MKNIIVIGGGAAGMMAAYAAADQGCHVDLLEKNEKLGKKIFITGKGRCNLTNACETEDLFRSVVHNPKFLYSAFYTFDNRQIQDLMEKNDCPVKVERGGRVFPVTDHSSDVIRTMEMLCRQKRVTIHLHTQVKGLVVEEESIKGVILSDGSQMAADAVIVATGGMSYESTGSTGDGYRFAKEWGHKIVELRPALVPLVLKENVGAELMGLALKNVSVTLTLEGKKKPLYHGFGEMLFTHFGISGPLILSASSYYPKEKEKQVFIHIDLKPALDPEQLDKRILRDFEEQKGKQFKNALGSLFPARLVPVMIRASGIDPEKKVSEISREERRLFVQIIKNWRLEVTGTRDFKEAIITAGGISVKEVVPGTMESKRIRNLYFAGEVLDLDAMTGGFNLQIAWSTGYLAGMSAAKERES